MAKFSRVARTESFPSWQLQPATIYLALEESDPKEAFSEADKIDSSSCAKRNIDVLLKNINKFWGGQRLLLDRIIVHLLTKFNLVNPTIGRVSVDDARLISWLDSAHCGTNQSPLYGVIDLLLKFVSKGDHINRCLTSVITHILLRHVESPPHRIHDHTNMPCYDMLCQLLKLGVTKEKEMMRVLKHAGKCIRTRELVETVAELHPTIVLPYTEYARSCFYNHLLHLFNSATSSPSEKRTRSVDAWLDLLRGWLEVGIALELPVTLRSGFSRNPLFLVLHHLLGVHSTNSKECVRWYIRLALWLALANPELSSLMFGLPAEQASHICAHFPNIATAVLCPVHSLQQLCTSVIRHHLRLPLLGNVSSLPLPVPLQRYIAGGFLDLSPFVVENIAEEVESREKLQLPNQEVWFQDPPVLPNLDIM